MSSGWVWAEIFLVLFFGVIPGTIYLLCVLIGSLSPERSQLRKRCLPRFPIFKLSPKQPVFRIHVTSIFFFVIAAMCVLIANARAVDGVTVLTDDNCTSIWRVCIALELCFTVTIMWYLYERAAASNVINSAYSKLLKFVKYYLYLHSCLPVVTLFTVEATPSPGYFGYTCRVVAHTNRLVIYLIENSILEVCLFLLFLLPLRDLLTDTKNQLLLSLSVTNTRVPHPQEVKRLKQLEDVARTGFWGSCLLLFLDLATAWCLIITDDQLILGSSFCVMGMFATLVYLNRRNWEYVTDGSNRDVSHPVVVEPHDRINVDSKTPLAQGQVHKEKDNAICEDSAIVHQPAQILAHGAQ
eukprot:TRINITY_DN23908_c0_g1_i1.p1 TRINITY_DN23908_c0_g1~~TRINITY_DN23908_c0_g1_i1.p1  ORF type:complete len:354 (-),score=53.45 TRINITY_DN23908_c0_g1_i1:176-1237(-)